MQDILYAIQQSQMQKSIGELKALQALYYNPYSNENEQYYKIKEMIKDFVDELTDNFG